MFRKKCAHLKTMALREISFQAAGIKSSSLIFAFLVFSLLFIRESSAGPEPVVSDSTPTVSSSAPPMPGPVAVADLRPLFRQGILVDGDHFAVAQDALGFGVHGGEIVARQQGRARDR